MQVHTILVLFITTDKGTSDAVARILCDPGMFKLQVVPRELAAARIAGGGVDVVIEDWCAGLRPCYDQIARDRDLELPVFAICDPELQHQHGQEDRRFIARTNLDALPDAIRRAIGVQKRFHAGHGHRSTAPRGLLVGVIGAKGGVGTTTLALNLAAEWSRSREVILAEFRE